MRSLFVLAIIYCSLFNSVNTHLILGKCPKVPAVKNVSLTEIQGVWFEAEKFYFPFEAYHQQCSYIQLYPPNIQPGETKHTRHTRHFSPLTTFSDCFVSASFLTLFFQGKNEKL